MATTIIGYVGIVLLALLMVGFGTYWYAEDRTEAKIPERLRLAVIASTQELSAACEHAVARWGETESKLESLQKAIEGILKERDQWRDLYSSQSIAHGNAQTWMMDLIGLQQTELRKAGVAIETPTLITQIRDDFLEQHVNPTLKRTGIPSIHKGPETASLADIASSVKTLSAKE